VRYCMRRVRLFLNQHNKMEEFRDRQILFGFANSKLAKN
jgi:hypothetical protein